MKKIIEDLNWRYATKAFDPSKNVSDEDLQTILEAFRLSASSFGLQPWKLFVVKSQDLKEKLLPFSWNQAQVTQAPYHLVFARNTADGDTLVNEFIEDTAKTRGADLESLQGYKDVMLGFLANMSEEQKIVWANKQVYIALGNIMTVLAEMRIDSCAMEGISPADYDEVLGLKDKWFASVVALPIGYRAEDDKYASLEKVRFPVEKVTEIL